MKTKSITQMYYTVPVLLAILFFNVCANSISAKTVVRLTNGEFPPYLSENLKYNGYISRVVKEAFELSGVEVKYVFYPWKRAIYLSETGDYDGSVIWSKLEERLDFFYYSDPVLNVKLVFFHLKTYDFKWHDFNSLKNIKIGTSMGYKYCPTFTDAVNNGIIKIQEAPNDESNFKKLLNKRIDIFPNDIQAGYYVLYKNFTEKESSMITHNPNEIGKDVYYLIISKKNKDGAKLIKLFNKGLARLKENGKYEQYEHDSREGKYIIATKRNN